MSWPPNPNKQPNQSNQPNNEQNSNNSANQNGQQQQLPAGREWQLIEKTLLASVEEQRRARRWNTLFKVLTFVYLFFILLSFGRGCSSSGSDSGLKGVHTDKPHIAVVEVNGVISTDDEANARDINKALNKAFENEHSKAVALNINSPGGSPVQSDEIWQNMMALREEHPDKKLYAIIGDIGASGAYYIASAADEIYVNPSSLVGSIGVILPSYDLQGLMEKTGIKDRTMHAGEYKDILSMGRPMTEFETQHIDNVLASTHDNFINAVKKGRGEKLINPEENKLFTGLFWSGSQAIELGLADKEGSLTQLEKTLDIEDSINYTPVDPMKQLLDRFAVKMGSGFGAAVKQELLSEDNNTQLR